MASTRSKKKEFDLYAEKLDATAWVPLIATRAWMDKNRPGEANGRGNALKGARDDVYSLVDFSAMGLRDKYASGIYQMAVRIEDALVCCEDKGKDKEDGKQHRPVKEGEGDYTLMYLGESTNVSRRWQAYTRTGSHLHSDTCKVCGKQGHSMLTCALVVHGCIWARYVSVHPDSIKGFEQYMLALDNYPWNTKLNGGVNKEEVRYMCDHYLSEHDCPPVQGEEKKEQEKQTKKEEGEASGDTRTTKDAVLDRLFPFFRLSDKGKEVRIPANGIFFFEEEPQRCHGIAKSTKHRCKNKGNTRVGNGVYCRYHVPNTSDQ